MEFIITIALVVAAIGGSAGFTVPASLREFPPPPPPPTAPQSPPFPICMAFPGSVEWNQCWGSFNTRMAEFQKNMATFQEKMEAHRSQMEKWEKQFPGSGPINQLSTSGYSIRSRGIAVSTHTINDRMFLDVQIGHPDKLDVTYSDTTMRFDIVNGGTVTQWLTITPPTAADLKKIKYVQEDDMLHVWIAGVIRPTPNYLSFMPFNTFFRSTSSNFNF